MRPLLALICTVLSVAGCHKNLNPASAIRLGDPAAAKQLLFGFYPPEKNAWCWTGKHFVLFLGTPPFSGRDGAELLVRLYFPERQMNETGPVTVNADIDCWILPPATYAVSGEHYYKRQIPREALMTNILLITFDLDKTSPPSATDGRELGVVMTEARLEPLREKQK